MVEPNKYQNRRTKTLHLNSLAYVSHHGLANVAMESLVVSPKFKHDYLCHFLRLAILKSANFSSGKYTKGRTECFNKTHQKCGKSGHADLEDVAQRLLLQSAEKGSLAHQQSIFRGPLKHSSTGQQTLFCSLCYQS